MAPTPLPPTPGDFDPPTSLAYTRLLSLEAQTREPTTRTIRMMGYMLIYAPSAQGRVDVAESINTCATDEDVIKLGQDNLYYFVNYFKARATKPTPAPSSHPSRQSVDDLRDEILNNQVEAPTDYSNAKKQALVRDDYRCMLTGFVDAKSYYRSSRLRAQIESLPPPGPDLRPTECCHILPQYIGHGLGNDDKAKASAGVRSVIQLFGGIPFDDLNGGGIHHLGNIMTLEEGLHSAFDNLFIWLEPVEDSENQYLIRRLPRMYSVLPETVTFTAQGDLPLPDPRYLALHASCAKVVHMSGAAELIDKILYDLEYTKVLSEDGSSSELLGHLLSAELAC